MSIMEQMQTAQTSVKSFTAMADEYETRVDALSTAVAVSLENSSRLKKGKAKGKAISSPTFAPPSASVERVSPDEAARAEIIETLNGSTDLRHTHELFQHGKCFKFTPTSLTSAPSTTSPTTMPTNSPLSSAPPTSTATTSPQLPLDKPTIVWKSSKAPRKDHDCPAWLTATEFTDTAATADVKAQKLASLLKASRKTVLYTGAGISASVIGQAALSGQNKVGWKKDLRGAPPTQTHHALARLDQLGYIDSWIQQNHDGLPQKAGFPQDKINEVHGSWYNPANPVVKYTGSLKDDEEEWMTTDAETADLVLVIGTSLGGLYADDVAEKTADRAQHGAALGTVCINLQQTPMDGKMSLRMFGKSDGVLADVLRHLGDAGTALPSAAVSWTHVPSCVLVPYDADGNRLADAKPHRTSSTKAAAADATAKWMWLDLRNGAAVKVHADHNCQGAEQPNTIHIGATKGQKYRGKKLLRAPADGTGVVEERNERTGQIKCRLSGAAVNLGIWWLDAAMRGALPSLPLINRVPTFQQHAPGKEQKQPAPPRAVNSKAFSKSAGKSVGPVWPRRASRV